MGSLDSKETPGKGGKTICLNQKHLSMGYFAGFSHEAPVGLYGLAVLQYMHNIISGRSERLLYQSSNT